MRSMQIGQIHVAFVSHTTFLFGLPDGTVLLTDPYFSGAFEWNGRVETHLQRPDVRPESITACDGIFVSHAHGDHCDPDAIQAVARGTQARIFTAPSIVETLAARGLDPHRLVPLRDAEPLHLGGFDLIALGGYDKSFDAQGRMNKFSLLIRHGDTTLWYSGDCHSVPPGLPGRNLDAVFAWTSPGWVDALAGVTPAPKRFIIMHHDQHSPGNFWCNRDPRKDATFVAGKLPGVEVIVPDRLGTCSNFAPCR